MPLPNTASYDEVIAELKALTGINQKSELAATLGSPSLSTDVVSKLINDLQIQKNLLAVNLTNQGQSSSGTEPLSHLANKISNIVKGKKFAMGTIPAMAPLNLVPTTYLPFVPKTVIVQCMQGVSSPNGAYVTKDNSMYKVYSENFYFGYSSGLRGQIIMGDSASFDIAHTADNYRSYEMNWIAFE